MFFDSVWVVSAGASGSSLANGFNGLSAIDDCWDESLQPEIKMLDVSKIKFRIRFMRPLVFRLFIKVEIEAFESCWKINMSLTQSRIFLICDWRHRFDNLLQGDKQVNEEADIRDIDHAVPVDIYFVKETTVLQDRNE